MKNGARMVYAVDVGYGQFAWSLRKDRRVVLMERTNIRNLTPEMLGIKPQLAVIDVSFISLSLVLPVVKKLLADDGEAICLIKPQFEAERAVVGEKGVVNDSETHVSVLEAFMRHSAQSGFHVRDITHSPIKGPQGNIEFLGWLGYWEGNDTIDIHAVVSGAHKAMN